VSASVNDVSVSPSAIVTALAFAELIVKKLEPRTIVKIEK
jgi:hypothetical protein